ncbi:MAG: terpene cyclase/mutase family protein [Euryarchaeota archaeon]|nr:terpene cyclase/mutase family protein [Euryarchaeota archaeon]
MTAMVPMQGAAATAEDDAVALGVSYIKGRISPDGSIGGLGDSYWAAIALAAAGEDVFEVRSSPTAPSLGDHLCSSGAGIPPTATNRELALAAVVSIGGDPRGFCGIDYVAGVETYFDGTQVGSPDLLNDDYFALIALGAAWQKGYSVDAQVLEKTRDWVLANQLPHGGWGYARATEPSGFVLGGGADVDDTAAALMGLRLVGESPDSVASLTGLNYMSSFQDKTSGGCGSTVLDPVWYGSASTANSASTAWAVSAIRALGGDARSSTWTTPAGEDPVQFLLALQGSDGHFDWMRDNPGFGGPSTTLTAFAVIGLTGTPLVVV